MSCRLPIVAIVGPTASGKSRLAVDLAQNLHAEIINTDAMALYRGMDIGTAKPTAAERAGVPHHLLDTLTVDQPASVAEFQGWARTLISDLRARGTTPVLVGGSALYTRAIVDRFDFPGTDPAIRERLEQELADHGPGPLFARLRAEDPTSADRIEPENGRRIVRALEVIELTGKPFSARLPVQEYADPHTVQIGVHIDREILDRRIELRVQRMFDDGLVAEVDHLLTQGLADGRTAGMAIGYRQVILHLRGELTLDEARERTTAATRKFARRQLAWWRNDPRIHWIGHDDPDRVQKALVTVSAVS